MTIEDRIKKIRRNNNLNQTEFGEKLGITRDSVKNIELGLLKKGVPDNIIKLISVTFNVNEEWLRTGKGEMFKQEKKYSLDEFLKTRNATELEIEFMKTYFNLDENIRKKIVSDFKKVALIEEFPNLQSSKNTSNKLSVTEEPETIPSGYKNMSVEELLNQANMIEELLEKKQAEKSLATQKQNENSETKKQINNKIS